MNGFSKAPRGKAGQEDEPHSRGSEGDRSSHTQTHQTRKHPPHLVSNRSQICLVRSKEKAHFVWVSNSTLDFLHLHAIAGSDFMIAVRKALGVGEYPGGKGEVHHHFSTLEECCVHICRHGSAVICRHGIRSNMDADHRGVCLKVFLQDPCHKLVHLWRERWQQLWPRRSHTYRRHHKCAACT